MKNLILAAFAMFTLISSAQAQEAFPNDTMTQIMSRGRDCGPVVGLTNGYFTQFNQYGKKKAIVINIAVRDDSYDKVIHLTNIVTGRQMTATFTKEYTADRLNAIYRYKQQNYAMITLAAPVDGESNYGVYNITVTMNQQTYSCSGVQVSVKLE